jgi:hypothetical protein
MFEKLSNEWWERGAREAREAQEDFSWKED